MCAYTIRSLSLVVVYVWCVCALPIGFEAVQLDSGLFSPRGLVFDDVGDLLVVERGTGRILK
jgi:hypothetical protein